MRPSVVITVTFCGERSSQALETRLAIEEAIWSDMRMPRSFSTTAALAGRSRSVNRESCGSTRCTRTCSTPFMVWMVRSSSASSARW